MSETARPRGAAMREHLLSVAGALFEAQGIRATSADRIIAEAGVTKVTFYRHFPAKDAVVVAHLRRLSDAERSGVETAASADPDDPVALIRRIASAIGAEACRPGFRGCPYINAAAEFAEPGHPVRVFVTEHRRWFRTVVTDLFREAGASHPERAAADVVLLRDGALVGGYLGDPREAADALSRAVDDLLSAELQPDDAPAPSASSASR